GSTKIPVFAGAAVYRSVAHSLGITHRPVNLSAGIRVIAGVFHPERYYDSRLKQWMKRLHGVATKYLENYLGWRRWLERWGEHNSPIAAIQAALGRENQFQLLMQT
nr:IS1595 family transposase [Nitrosomonas sp.]